MEYNVHNKMINGYIGLGLHEYMILELLIKMNGEPLTAEKITDILFEKESFKSPASSNSVRVNICRLNKKINGLIKARYGFGYYIDEEIKIR